MGSQHESLLKWLERGVLAASALVFGSWLVITVAHVDDNYNVGHVTGTWFALARYVNEGILYPQLFNGASFGGTRDMPLQFVMHAGLARVTGEYLVSGKLLAYTSAAALFTLVFVICRRISGSSVLAVGLVAAVVSTDTGLFVSTTVRGDTLPVALQLGAVYAVTRQSSAVSSRAAGSAGLLCALAFLSKLTAVWGPIALVAWLAGRDRRRLGVFLLSLAGCTGALFAAFEIASNGRMSQNIIGLAAAGGHTPVNHALAKFVTLGQTSAGATWVLAPFALAAVGVGIARRRITAYQISLVVAVVILLPVLSDVGTIQNHFIDAEALVAVVTAEAVLLGRPRTTTFVWPVVLVAVLWGTLTSYGVYMRPTTAVAVHTLFGRETFASGALLESTISQGDRILSEDPYVAVSRNQDPVVLDAFMLVRIARDHPEWQAQFIRQIRHHRFSKVVLYFRLRPRDRWWQVDSLGTPIATAIARNYRLVAAPSDLGPGEDYYVYAPK